MPVSSTQKEPIIGVRKITESWQDMLKSFQDNEVYASAVQQINSDKRKQEWLAVRLLLKELAGPEAIIDYAKNGAPVLRNSRYHISISHTGGFAAVILSEATNPGIDIEYRSERAWKLRSKYLGDKELTLFDTLCGQKTTAGKTIDSQTADNNPQNRIELATVCWCAKETAYKSLQQSEVDFIDHFHIQPFILSKKGSFLLHETKTPEQNTFLIHYRITEDYILTWCTTPKTVTI